MGDIVAGNRRDRPKREKVRRGEFKVPGGPSILNSVESKLRVAVRKWRETGTPESRGVVRGLAIAVATIRGPYDPKVREVEREFIEWDKERFS